MNSAALWAFLPLGYALSVAIELPVLLALLRKDHPLPRRVFAGFWLTACTYPIVVLFLPIVLDAAAHRTRYIVVAEIFAPVAEILLFYFYCRARPALPQASARDAVAILLANLLSFSLGEFFQSIGWL